MQIFCRGKSWGKIFLRGKETKDKKKTRKEKNEMLEVRKSRKIAGIMEPR